MKLQETGQRLLSAKTPAEIHEILKIVPPIPIEDSHLYLLADGKRKLTGDWDAGSWQIRAETFQSDVVGTAPLTVASTTMVTNLNAELLDDKHEMAFLLADGTRTLGGAWNMGNQILTNVNIDSGIITGITDLAIADGGTGASTAADARVNLDVIQDIADVVKDTHIDWGTGAGQISAVDVPIADVGAYYTGTEVEAALQEAGYNIERALFGLQQAGLSAGYSLTIPSGYQVLVYEEYDCQGDLTIEGNLVVL